MRPHAHRIGPSMRTQHASLPVPVPAAAVNRRVVWWTDGDFESQRKAVWNSPLNLVWRGKAACGKCGACGRAWKPRGDKFSVQLFFREPVQLDEIRIRQVWHAGVTEVSAGVTQLGW